LNEQVPVFKALSVAEQFTVVVPRAKGEPDAGMQVGVRVPSQLSVAVTANLTTTGPVIGAKHVPDTFVFPGQVTTGFSQSVTVTVNEQLPLFPALSVAQQVTVVVPTGKA